MHKKSPFFALMAVVMMAVMVLSACAPAATATPTAAAAEPTVAAGSTLAVGIVLPTKDEPRWIQDETRFKDALKAAGYSVEILFSQGDSAKEKANVEALITKGIKVLIICPQDGNAAAAAAAKKLARPAIKVISYDRLIRDTDAVDYYVTFDSIAVGAQTGPVPDRQSRRHQGQPALPLRRRRLRQQRLPLLRRRLECAPAQDRRRHLRDQELLRSGRAAGQGRRSPATREAKIIGQVTTNWDFNTAKNLAEANLTATRPPTRAMSSSWPRMTAPRAPSPTPSRPTRTSRATSSPVRMLRRPRSSTSSTASSP